MGSRTIRTLTALMGAMTVGAIVLMVMQTAPIRPPEHDLAAVSPDIDRPGVVLTAEVPIQPIKWHNLDGSDSVLCDKCGER